MNRRRFLSIAAACALYPGAGVASARRIAMGAEVQITLHGPPSVTGPALDEAFALLDGIERLFSLHRASALTRLNATGRLVPPPPGMVRLLTLCRDLHAVTEGLFDPSVQPLWQALATGADPAAARRAVGFDRVQIGADAVTLGTGQALTLNGIAQGWATDRVTEALAARGLRRALVNAGEFRALGGPWRIGIEDPQAGRLGMVTLDGGAVATSSPGAMALGGGAGHILNPLGDRPAPWRTVSVMAPTAALADALSTAFCLATRDRIAAIRARLDVPVTVRAVDGAGDLRTL